MCFSATASVASGLALLPAGAYAITAALRKNRAYLPVAVTPVVFGVQQLCEGGVWRGLDRGEPRLVEPAALGFLFFAFVFWPGWVPFGVALLEHRRWKRWAFFLLAAAGLAVGCLGYVPAARHYGDWLRVVVVGHSIHYAFFLPDSAEENDAGEAVYMAAVCLPLLASQVFRLRLLGVTMTATAAVSYFVFRYAFISVWCFFAALLSLQICVILYRVNPVEVSAKGGT
jgi:hypothetical protein